MKEIIIDHETITIPKGIQYISEWGEYTLPLGKCIVDKGVTGCGYTEYCLTNNIPIILCSPRKLLLENKAEQHKEDKNILYLKNENTGKEDKDKKEENLISFENSVISHIENCYKKNEAPKFLITYDSLYLLVNVLLKIDVLDGFIVVIDEFQSIFLDSYFKSNVEWDLVETLSHCENVIYLSATPYLEKHLKKLNEFKDLKYYYLDWTKSGFVNSIVLERKRVKSLTHECKKIILQYKEGNYPKMYVDAVGIIKSEEAVFYFNSVGDIKKIIKDLSLTENEVNVICSDTPENKRKLKSVGIKIGKVPLKNEKNKMFTFCTSTAYIGVDFYSDCAKTYVFADPNLSSLAMDISLDLPQIVGRQRNKNNPFKNDIVVFYRIKQKSEQSEELTREGFDRLQRKRMKATLDMIKVYDSIDDPEAKNTFLLKIENSIKVEKYTGDFLSISKRTGKPVWNKLIEIANERAWEVAQENYQDEINVTSAMINSGFKVKDYLSEEDKIAREFLEEVFYSSNQFETRLNEYCLFMDKYHNNKDISDIVNSKITDKRFSLYYNILGSSRCKSLKFRQSLLEKEITDILNNDNALLAVLVTFKSGEVYLKPEIKEKLKEIYTEVGISRVAKATDLEKYFNLKLTTVYKTIEGKRAVGFKISY